MSDSAAWAGDEQEADVSAMRVSRIPGWLPARSERMIAQEDRRERQYARFEERQRAEAAEAAHDRAVAAWKAEQERRGEHVSVQQILSGEGVPTIRDVLERVRLAEEAREETLAKWAPDGRRPDYVQFTDLMPEPAPAARSAVKLEMGNRIRHWRDRLEARRRADELDSAYPAYERPARRSVAPAARTPAYDTAGEIYRRACMDIGQPSGESRDEKIQRLVDLGYTLETAQLACDVS